jgi:2',3'-cyclic-nucleotide 2'-phosphodiesterase (5'-nucleotidase family)
MQFKKIALIFIAAISLVGCNTKNSINLGLETSQTNYLKVDSISAKHGDSSIVNYIMPYKNAVDSAMNQEIGFAEIEFFKNQPNGSLNNLSADMVLNIARKATNEDDYQPDICLLNYGGLRYPIAKGKITLASIFQLMPFENEIVILNLKGSQVESMFEYIAQTNGQPIAGCKISIKNNHFVNAEINGKPFDNSKNYRVATSDYLADGGDKMTFFKNPIEIVKTGILIREAMIEHIKSETKNGRTINSNTEERIKVLK